MEHKVVSDFSGPHSDAVLRAASELKRDLYMFRFVAAISSPEGIDATQELRAAIDAIAPARTA